MLRHYDKVELLQPVKVAEQSGYRFCSAAQLKKVNQIQVLKDMGFNIATIKELVDSENIEVIKSQFENRSAQIKEEDESLSIMYVAYSEIQAKPSSEILLSLKDIELICTGEITLNDFINQGGVTIFKEKMNKELVLQPFPQLIFLAELLKEDPTLLDHFLN